jgi:hypothetical protein
MNTALTFLAAPLVAVQVYMLAPATPKCQSSDLEVTSISAPDYDEKIKGAVFTVEVKNNGKKTSEKTTLLISDLDISLNEVKKLTNDKSIHELIGENNARSKHYGDNEYAEIDENTYDYDEYWEVKKKVDPLKPGQKITFVIELKGRWIYDSNCEIIAIIDPEEKQDDCNRENNVNYFFGWG